MKHSFTVTLLFAATALACTAHDAKAQDSPRSVIAFEKNLINDTQRIGVGDFKWSPDSKRIAYLRWNLGTVGIVDVDSGRVADVPGLHMNALRHFGWSADGSLLAVSSGPELKIVRLSDSKIVSAVNVLSGGFDSNIRFGDEMMFTRDGSQLLFQNPNDYDHIILASYDLAANAVKPILHSPFGTRRSSARPGSGRFQSYRDHLYFSTAIVRADEIVVQQKVIGSVDYGRTLRPTTCFVFELEDAKPGGTRSMDFPPPGEETADGSRDIADCRYSVATDYFVVKRRYPLIFEGEVPPFSKAQGSFFQALKLAGGIESPIFPSGESPEGRQFFQYELHPVLPWMVSLSYPSARQGILTLWDFAKGRALQRIGHDIGLTAPAFAPDGSRIAFGDRTGARIVVYKLDAR